MDAPNPDEIRVFRLKQYALPAMHGGVAHPQAAECTQQGFAGVLQTVQVNNRV